MCLGDYSNDQPAEMVVKTGNTYISETIRDSIEIPAANPGFATIKSAKKLSASDCVNGRQPGRVKLLSTAGSAAILFNGIM